MNAVFLSDAHLKFAKDERYARMVRFLSDLKDGRIHRIVGTDGLSREDRQVDDLFILGDFFDFWFCPKDRINPEFHLVINKLVELHKSGTRIHLAEGNHDFFMADYFRDVLGMHVYEEWATIHLDRMKVLIAHGDTADATDRVYLKFRAFLRSRFFYAFQRLIPPRLRWAIANLSSQASKEINDDNGPGLVEKMQRFAAGRLREDYDAVILGHCHQPVLRVFEVEGQKKTFVTLGDWIQHYSFVYYENRKFYLSYYQPETLD